MVESNGSPDEKSSPFYQKNEATCLRWQKLSDELNGEITGKYNAWSYKLFLKIDQPKPWRIIISRASYTSGNLLLSTRHQNRQDQINIQTKVDLKSKFSIKRPTRKGLLSLQHRKSLDFIEPLIDALAPLFNKKHIYKITLEEGILTIILHNANEEFTIIPTLINGL